MKTTMGISFSPEVRIDRSLRELRDLFQHRVNVEMIMEPFVSVPAESDASDLRQDLTARDWNAVSVRGPEGTVLTYLDRDELSTGVVASYTHPITPAMLIPNSSSVLNLFKVLGTRDYAFVLTSDGVTSIVTRVDLEKPPVRLLLFSYTQLFEARLQSLIVGASDAGGMDRRRLREHRSTRTRRILGPHVLCCAAGLYHRPCRPGRAPLSQTVSLMYSSARRDGTPDGQEVTCTLTILAVPQ